MLSKQPRKALWSMLLSLTAYVGLLDFGPHGAAPKQLTPLLEKLATQSNGAVRLAKMNIDEHPQIAQQLQVQSIPAVFAFKNGQPVDGFAAPCPRASSKLYRKNLVWPRARPHRGNAGR